MLMRLFSRSSRSVTLIQNRDGNRIALAWARKSLSSLTALAWNIDRRQQQELIDEWMKFPFTPVAL